MKLRLGEIKERQFRQLGEETKKNTSHDIKQRNSDESTRGHDK